MFKKGKFRMTKRATSNTNNKLKSNLVNSLPTLELNELQYLRLSPKTQSFVQCRIGKEINSDNNWVFISKIAILASTEFSNDFMAAIDLVREYPEDKMLIGSYGFDLNISEEYQLCTTVACKNSTLNELAMRRERITRIYDMPVYAWISMGSETEVLGMQNFNLRSLLVVEIESVFPIFIGKRVFSIRAANDSVYVECFTSRHEYKNVWRKRVDAACQACSEKKNVYIQTRTSTELHHHTQYEQAVRVQTPNPEVTKKILQLLNNHVYEIEDLLIYNYHIHLDSHDYTDFLNPYVEHVYTNYKEIVACQDIRNCQGKQVSCVSWNPFISGIFVASYVHTSFDDVIYSEPKYSKEECSEHVALLWSFSDMQKPKLYLHSAWEITNVSFCPFDENIVVGGCSNGQIIIWDIRGKLSKVENKKVLSPTQRENQMQISNLILWMKKLPSVRHVDACVFSSLQHGHKTAITSITWLPPDYYISSTGQYTKSLEENMHMQFVTSSLEDGIICVWDLKHHNYVKVQKQRKPLQRLNKVPAALYKDDSPLKKNLAVFIPIFVLRLKDPLTQKPLHIRSTLFNRHEYQYEKLRSLQVENNFERQYFQLASVETLFNVEQSFVVNTVSGLLYDCTWEGFTYDHGNKINFDSCTINPYAAIHDAPVKMCVANKEDANIYLSIGGKVFAIWHRKQPTVGIVIYKRVFYNIKSVLKLQQPILWRKWASSYIFGTWSYVHPFEILLFTSDGFIQLWNFFVNSKDPTYTVRAHGMPPVGIYSNVGVEHYIRNAILLLDRFGAIRIHTAGSKLAAKSVTSFETHESMEAFIETKKQVQNCVTYWSNRFKKDSSAREEIKTVTLQADVTPSTTADKKKEEVSRKKEFEKKQHKYMYEQLTEYKSIQMKQLEMNKKILDEVIIQNKELGRKCAKAISNKAEFFEKKKRQITCDGRIERKIIKMTLLKECATTLKKQFFEHYLLIEQEYVNNELEEYTFVFDWSKIEQIKYKTRKTSCRQRGLLEHQAFKYNFRDTVHYKTVDLYDD